MNAARKLNDPDCKVPPDWWCISFDETVHWNIAEEDKPYIEKMMGVYFYDRSEYTYCCEVTPSYWLRHLGNVAYCRWDTPDEVRERIYDKYEIGGYDDSCYMHVRVVEAIPAERKVRYGLVDGWADEKDRGEEQVREYWQGNPAF